MFWEPVPSFGFSVHGIQSMKPHNNTFENRTVCALFTSNSTSHKNCRLLRFIYFFIRTVFQHTNESFFFLFLFSCFQTSYQYNNLQHLQMQHQKGPKQESLIGEDSGPGLSYCSTVPQDAVEPVTGGSSEWCRSKCLQSLVSLHLQRCVYV